jgi:hypothetical protein
MNTYTCDRCLKVVDSLHNLIREKTGAEIQEELKRTRGNMPFGCQDHITLAELCPECWTALMEFLKPTSAMGDHV